MIPCLCFLRMALTYIVPVRYCMNRGSANGAPAGGAFLVDIPEDWEPRAKQQPTGLIACGATRRRPVRAPSIVLTKRKTRTQRLNSDKVLFSIARGRERCDRNGHAVFLRPGVDFATTSSETTGISTSSTKLK